MAHKSQFQSRGFAQPAPSMQSGSARRKKQLFEGARLSQVQIPQQTESDEIESGEEDDEDVTPQAPKEDYLDTQVMSND